MEKEKNIVRPAKAELNQSFKANKRDTMKAAKDLGYGYYVLGLLEKAKTEGELERIMIDARHGKYAFM